MPRRNWRGIFFVAGPPALNRSAPTRQEDGERPGDKIYLAGGMALAVAPALTSIKRGNVSGLDLLMVNSFKLRSVLSGVRKNNSPINAQLFSTIASGFASIKIV